MKVGEQKVFDVASARCQSPAGWLKELFVVVFQMMLNGWDVDTMIESRTDFQGRLAALDGWDVRI